MKFHLAMQDDVCDDRFHLALTYDGIEPGHQHGYIDDFFNAVHIPVNDFPDALFLKRLYPQLCVESIHGILGFDYKRDRVLL